MGEIKRQSIYNSVLSYFGAALAILLIYLQPNLIPVTDIGLTRLLYSFSWMAAVIMPLGVGSATMRFFPKIRNDENKHHGLFALLLLLTTIGAFIIALLMYLNSGVFVDFYSRSPEFSSYFNEAIIFAYVLSLISVFTVYSVSLFRTTITVFLTDVFVRIGQIVITVMYHYDWMDRHTFILSYMGIFLVQLILLFVYLLSLRSVSFKINWSFFKTLNLRDIGIFSGLMALTSVASMGLKFIDQLMIGHFCNEDLVGIYATSVMMCAVMEIPFNSLERIAQPKIAYAWGINDVTEVNKIYELSSRYLFFIGSLLFCILWASIDFIFMFLPPEFHQGKMAFYIVSISSLINLLTGVNSSVIMVSHKYFATTVLLLILIVVALISNYLLIGPYGISGAAIATLVSVSTFNLLKYIYILYRFKMQPFTQHTLYILLCLALSLGLIIVLPSGLHPFMKAFIGSGFACLLFALVNIRLKSVEEINKLLRRLKLIS